MNTLNTSILDSLNSHIAVLDSDGIIIYTNKSWDSFYDKNKTGLTNKKSGVGVNYLKLCLEASKNNKEKLRSYEGIKSVIDGETDSYSNNYSVNENKRYTMNVIPLNKKEGRVVVTHEDVTEQVLAQEELVLEKLKFEALVSESDIGMVILDDSFHIMQANNSFCDFIGYSEQELQKFTPLDISVKDDIISSEKMLDNMAKGKKKKRKMEKKYIRKDGEIVWGEVTNKQVEVLPGKILYYATIIDITKRKKDEIEIGKTQNQLNNIVDYAGVGIVYANSEREVISANEKFLNILGYKKEEEIIGKTIMSFTHPEDLKKSPKEVVKNENRGSSNFDMEKRYIRKDKSIVWVNLNVSTIEDDDTEEVRNFVGMVRDITEKKEAEKLLIDSEHKFRSLFDSANDGIFIIDKLTKKIIASNKAASKQLGYEQEELVGKPIMYLYSEEVLPFAKSKMKEMMEKGELIFEIQQKKKDGSIIDVEIKSKMFEINGKEVFQSFITDVTEKKIEKKILKETIDRLKLATSNANIGVWDWDVKNNVLVWDDSMYDLYKVEKKDFSGAFDAWEKTLYVHDVVPANKEVQMALSGEKKFDTVFRILTDNGDLKYIHGSGKVDFDDEGNAIRMIGVNIDVTDKELMEQEKHNAIIKTEEAERQRISHDLHDGLGQRIAAANMWINALENLVEDQLDKETLAIFKVGKELINDATKETRLVSHNIMPRSLKEYGLEKTIIELVNNIKKINQNISIELKSNLKGTRFDGVKELSVFRVIQESINNALKHSKADKIDVILNVDDNLLFVNVNDNGQGFVVDSVTNKNASGIGLLSLSQRIKMIGGKLNIESKPTQGTKIAIVVYLEKLTAVLSK